MSRPCKRRRVCEMPSCGRFGPKNGGGSEAVKMTVDEFESVRLIDLEGMTQEQCAVQMNVARTTAQAIYGSARLKLAQCVVNGRELIIEGGNYVLCGGNAGCGGRCHSIKTLKSKEANQMRIAVTYEDGQIFQHFGHTERFKVYDIEDGKVTTAAVVNTNGSGHGALADILKRIDVDTLICGGIGGGAQMALAEAGITLYGGASGDADKAVEALLAGTLDFNPDAQCNHHGHEHRGGCGEHGCGGHCGE